MMGKERPVVRLWIAVMVGGEHREEAAINGQLVPKRLDSLGTKIDHRNAQGNAAAEQIHTPGLKHEIVYFIYASLDTPWGHRPP